MFYRVTFEIHNDYILLRKIGPHDVLKIHDPANFLLAPLHRHPNPRRHPCIVEGAVVLPEEGGIGAEVQIDCLQGVVHEAREVAPAHLQCAEMSVGKGHLQPRELVAEEADIEGGVMRDKDAAGDEIIEPREGLLRFGLAFEHLIGDPVDGRTCRRNRDSGIDERREFSDNGAVFDGDGADLDDSMAVAR